MDKKEVGEEEQRDTRRQGCGMSKDSFAAIELRVDAAKLRGWRKQADSGCESSCEPCNNI